MNELALFAGAGGGILGTHLLGFRTICAVERDAYAAGILAQRQNDQLLPPFPIWSDVETFDGRPWRGRVDLISGGFPCQDISLAGSGAGITGERSGLWKHFARIIRQVLPLYVLVENSPALTSRGLGTVLGDLAAMGYDANWGVIAAQDAIWLDSPASFHPKSGALLSGPAVFHERERLWILAWHRESAHAQAGRLRAQRLPHSGSLEPLNHQQLAPRLCPDSTSPHTLSNGRQPGRHDHPEHERHQPPSVHQDGDASLTHRPRLEERQSQPSHHGQELPPIERASWWATEPELGRVAHGMAHRVDRLRALGNGQVPSVAALAWLTLFPRQLRRNDQ